MLTAFNQQEPSDLLLTVTELFIRYSQKVQTQTPQTLIHEIKELRNTFYFAYLGKNKESAMDLNEIKKSVVLFETLEKKYGPLCEERGNDAIINEIIAYLLDKLSKNNITAENRFFDANDSSEIRLYKTALRALLDAAPEGEHPNYLLVNAPEVYGADKRFHARKMLSLFWLAATDPNIETEPGLDKTVVIEWEKSEVIRMLADIRRGNNKTQFDLPEPIDVVDRISCGPGVINRIACMFNYNLMLRRIRESLHSILDDFLQRFDAFVIARFKDLAPSTQMQVIYAYYYQVANDEADQENAAFTDFFNALLSEKNATDFIERLQAEFGPFEDSLFKSALMIFFEKWLKNKHSMATDLLGRLESISQESQVKFLYDKTLHENVSAVRTLEKLESLLSQIKALKEKLAPLNYLEKYELSQIQHQYASLYQDFQQVIENDILSPNQAQFYAQLSDATADFEKNTGKKQTFLTTPQAKNLDWLPLWVKKCQTSLLKLHQGIVEAITDHASRLEETDHELFSSQPTILHHFSPNLISHEEIRLVKAHLYRHAAKPESLHLQDYLSLHCSIQIFGLADNTVRILFIHPDTVTAPQHSSMSLEDFRVIAKTEQAYHRSISDPMDVLQSQFSHLQKSSRSAKVYLEQLNYAFMQNPTLFDKALSLQTKTSLHGILAREISTKLRTAIESKQLPQGKNAGSVNVSDDLEFSLRALYISRPKGIRRL